MKKYLPEKVVLSGGGTGGSVMPLIAIAETLQEEADHEIGFIFIGTRKGIEKSIASNYGIEYKSIVSGKLRRYFDFRNLIDPFKIPIGFIQSFFMLLKFKPELVLTAGSFVAFPVVLAAYILNIPVIAHQQDIKKSLTNKLISPFAEKVTLTFKKSQKDFSKKSVLTGNPIRKDFERIKRDAGVKFFKIRSEIPVILILGGGTGALSLNKIIKKALPELKHLGYVIHVTGKGKKVASEEEKYLPFDFMGKDIKFAYAVSDVVVSRAGISTLSELAYLEKPIIMIPLPDSHQEENAAYFESEKAAVTIRQKDLKSSSLIKEIRRLLLNPDLKREMVLKLKNTFPKEANKNYLKLIKNVMKEIYGK